MTAPGTTVVVRDSAPPRSAPTDTSVWFAAGVTEQGPANTAKLIESMAELQATFGARVSYGLIYDSLDTFFREGGSRAYVSRVVGPSPVSAAHTFLDASAGNSLVVTAETPGVWGNSVQVQIVAGAVSGYQIKVIIGGVTVEQSPDLTTQADAVAWALTTSVYLSIAAGNGVLAPAVVAAQTLSGGTDDHAAATDATWLAALNGFGPELGPGQVSMPGRTSTQSHLDLLTHAANNNRVALLDNVDTGSESTLVAAAAAARTNGRHGAVFAPWAVVPGVTAGTTRTVPYSAVEAGIIARNDSLGIDPNVPAAGPNGKAQYAIGLSQPAWNAVDRGLLNDAGVNAIRIVNGDILTYGYRTLADPTNDPNFELLSNARLVMDITALADVIAERYVFAQLDGRGHTFGDFAADLGAMLAGFWAADALYGATQDDAFVVDVGAQVNTPTTIAAGQLNAQITLRLSPFAERVQIFITKRSVTEGVS